MEEVAVHKHQLGGCCPASARLHVCQSLPALRLLKNQMPKPTTDKEHFYLLQKSFHVDPLYNMQSIGKSYNSHLKTGDIGF